ncbi:MAG: YkgB family protein [Sphingomonas sp.]|nr:YkgB family protein [Sphingomonas sp.]
MSKVTLPAERSGIEALRWALVLIFALFGTAKFAGYEAEGVAKIAEHYPLFAWMYPLWGVRGASNVIGTIELATGAALAIGAFSPRVSLLGGLMGMCTFLVTLSFMLGAPIFDKELGAPFIAGAGQFLVKDAVLLAGCYAIALASARRAGVAR